MSTSPKLTPEKELASFGYKQELDRSLGVWELTAFGLNYMIPIAPAIIFGFILKSSGGSVALPYLLALFGMSFTALSYAILLHQFPIAGSLYSYVSRSISKRVGFVAGWVLLLDYLLIPTVTAMSASIYLHQLIPSVPYVAALVFFTFGTGCFNLFGIHLMAKLGLWLLLIGEIVIFVGFVVWGYAVHGGLGVGHLFSAEPFKFSGISALATSTSIAVMSYLGFDAITTLSEEAKNPKLDIPRAIFFSVVIGGITMFLTGYIAMLTLPHWQQFQNNDAWLNTTLFYVAKITGGRWFEIFYTSGFLLAMLVFNVVATAAGSRILFGMGRDRVLPHSIFGAINKKWKTPHWNILLIVIFQFLLGLTFTVASIAELVNYGALLGFILLNIAVIWLFYIKRQSREHYLKHLFSPLCGVIVLTWVFLSMQTVTLVVGTIWLTIGFITAYFNPHCIK
jgi:putrescine importer